jgi:glutathione peroxidase
LFKYLTTAPNPDFTGEIKWNFEKFLIDENGNLIHRFRSQTTPLDPALTKYL